MINLTEKEIDLKNRLVKIRDSDWNFPDGLNYYKFVSELLENIGSVDYELRDHLILAAIYHIFEDIVFTAEEFNSLLSKLLSEEHLFNGLGLQNDDSVFNRTFSALIIQLILDVNFNSDDKFLSENQIVDIYNDVKNYYKREVDLRGFDIEKGWAHSTAHTADLLGTLVCYDCFKEDLLLEVLQIIKEKVCVDYYTYVNEEDERLINVFMNIYDKNCIHIDDMINWIYSFDSIDENQNIFKKECLRENKKIFLRSLYFRFKEAQLPIEYMYAVESVLLDLTKYY